MRDPDRHALGEGGVAREPEGGGDGGDGDGCGEDRDAVHGVLLVVAGTRWVRLVTI